jgi:hypothetical protein
MSTLLENPLAPRGDYPACRESDPITKDPRSRLNPARLWLQKPGMRPLWQCTLGADIVVLVLVGAFFTLAPTSPSSASDSAPRVPVLLLVGCAAVLGGTTSSLGLRGGRRLCLQLGKLLAMALGAAAAAGALVLTCSDKLCPSVECATMCPGNSSVLQPASNQTLEKGALSTASERVLVATLLLFCATLCICRLRLLCGMTQALSHAATMPQSLGEADGQADHWLDASRSSVDAGAMHGAVDEEQGDGLVDEGVALTIQPGSQSYSHLRSTKRFLWGPQSTPEEQARAHELLRAACRRYAARRRMHTLRTGVTELQAVVRQQEAAARFKRARRRM